VKIVYFITRSDTIGGAQIHVRDLSLEMIKRGHDVTVFLGGNGVYADHLKGLNINVVSIHSLHRSIRFFSDIKSIIEFWKNINLINPDIISLHSVKAGFLGRIVSFSKGIPFIFTAPVTAILICQQPLISNLHILLILWLANAHEQN